MHVTVHNYYLQITTRDCRCGISGFYYRSRRRSRVMNCILVEVELGHCAVQTSIFILMIFFSPASHGGLSPSTVLSVDVSQRYRFDLSQYVLIAQTCFIT